jgi:hypothetical protein
VRKNLSETSKDVTPKKLKVSLYKPVKKNFIDQKEKGPEAPW